MKCFLRTACIFVCVCLGSLGLLYLLFIQPGPSGVAASLRLADGSEYMVTQRCNWSVEPYTVSFFMRAAGDKRWGWCYIDHQSNRWFHVAMSYDPTSDVVTVTRNGVWAAALDRKRSTFAIGKGKPRRELPAPQDFTQPEFSFP